MISYAITVCNEYPHIKNLIEHLVLYTDLTKDEIIVLYDSSKKSDHVQDFCENYQNKGYIKFYQAEFNNDFAEWKNQFKSLCSQEYIFQIDADEIPNPYLLQNLHEFLSMNSDIELFWVPRENYVFGYEQKHIDLWNWKIDEKNRINFPDYQPRLFKNLPNIKWMNKVHETITGTDKYAPLPEIEEFCLMHKKTIAKQESQNEFYDKLIKKLI